ncbi:hypothetical protein ACHAXS_000384 [Conticribra weissflogii]
MNGPLQINIGRLLVINLTWAFKLNCYQGGMVKKFKAHFCARGDQQLEGVNCFET